MFKIRITFDNDHLPLCDIIGTILEGLMPLLLNVSFDEFSRVYSSETDVCPPAEKPGAAAAPAEAPAATPAKKQDNLFFIEEPKPVRVTESESVLPLRGSYRGEDSADDGFQNH